MAQKEQTLDYDKYIKAKERIENLTKILDSTTASNPDYKVNFIERSLLRTKVAEYEKLNH